MNRLSQLLIFSKRLAKAIREIIVEHILKVSIAGLSMSLAVLPDKVKAFAALGLWLATSVWACFWPPSDIQAWLYAAVGLGVLPLTVFVIYRGHLRSEDDEESRIARNLRIKERARLTRLARQKDPNAPSAVIDASFLGESWRDHKVRRSIYFSFSSMAIAIAMIFLFVTNLFSLSAVIYWRPSEIASDVLISLQSVETGVITSALIKADEKCNFYRRVQAGKYRGIAYRIKGNVIQWSEIHPEVGEHNTQIKLRDFPEFECPYEPFAPVEFSKPGDWEINPNDNAILASCQTELQHFDGLILVEGRADDTNYPVGSGRDNFWLSLQRCSSVIERLSLVIHDTMKLVPVPLANQRPLTGVEASKNRDRERSSLIIPLRRQPYMQSPTLDSVSPNGQTR